MISKILTYLNSRLEMQKNKKMQNRSEKKSLKQEILKIFKNWISSTTCHGLVNIVHNEKLFFKIMWFILFIGSFAITCYLIIDTVFSFLAFEVHTKIRIYPEELPMNFPVVTICPVNSFRGAFAQELIKKVLNENQIFDPFNMTDMRRVYNLSKSDELTMNKNIEYLFFLVQNNIVSMNLTNEQKQSLGLSLETILLSCYIGEKKCDANDFHWFYSKYDSNCFSFNSGKNNFNGSSDKSLFQITSNGQLYGLKLELFLPYEDDSFIDQFSNKTMSYLKISNGLKIYIGDPIDYPNHYISAFVGLSTDTWFELKRVKTKILPYPFSQCVMNTGKNSDYKQSSCISSCYVQYLRKECQCDMLTNKKEEMCLNIKQLLCDYKAFDKYYREIIFDDECSEKCQIECIRTAFEYTKSNLDYPSENYLSILMSDKKLYASKFKNKSREEIKKSLINLNIYFKNMEYTQFEELEKMTILDLISSFGGLLGLFLGLSWLSLAELVDVFLKILFIFFKLF
jgi:amiloride-sensitive sodium channel